MANNTKWNEEDLIKKGFSKDSDGNWRMNPLNIKNKLRDEFNAFEKLEEKEIFEPKPKPPTSWFIQCSVPSKKNSRQNFVNKAGRQLSLPSKKHAEYVKNTEPMYAEFGRQFRQAVELYCIKPPYKIEFTFIRGTRHSWDYANALQTCEDLMKDQYKKKVMVRRGWFPDDSADWIIPSFQPYRYDKENPGVIIKLLF